MNAVSVSILNQQFHDLNPLVCGWEDCSPGHGWGPAARDYYLVHYIQSGRGVFERKGIQAHLSSGSIFLIRPEELTFYQADSDDPWHYVWIGFSGARCAELLANTALADDRATLAEPRLGRLFADIRTETELQSSVELYLCARLYEFFALLQRPRDNQPVKNEYVRRAADYIKANYAQPVSIESMARLIGIDRRYLCRIFAAETGQTPRDYLIQYRLERAAYYLTERGYAVQDAARSVGYEDVFNFSKAFKRHFGLAPRQYRNQGQGRI